MAPSFVQAAVSVLFASSVWATSGTSSGSVLVKRDPEVPSVLPGTWQYQGCYTDGAPRTLTGDTFANTTGMTPKLCIEFCDAKGFIYAGAEYAQECFCGSKIANGGVVAPAGDCNMACKGNASEACGGPGRLSVFWNGQDPPAGPSHNPGTLGYGLLGCYTEGTTGRALTNVPAITGPLTISKCIAACKNGGFALAGAEYAEECFCGNTLTNTPDVAPEGLAGCNMLCKGNSSEFCGAGNRLNVYKLDYEGTSSTVAPVSSTTVTPSSSLTSRPISSSSTSTQASITVAPSSTISLAVSSASSVSAVSSAAPTLSRKPVIGAYTRQGCYTEIPGGRALTGAAFYSFDAMTLNYCATSCAGFSYFGVEYGGECFCGNTLNVASQKNPDAECDFLCPGNPFQYCGAGNRMELYRLSSQVSSTSVVVSSTISSTTQPAASSSISSSVTTPVVSSSISSTTTIAVSSSVLSSSVAEVSSSMSSSTTLAVSSSISISTTSAVSSSVSSLTTLAVSSSILSSSTTAVVSSSSSSVIISSSSTTLAPSSTTSIMSSSTISTSSVPTVSGVPAGWKYGGCYREGTTGRAMEFAQEGGSTNNVQNCINTCAGKGYSVAGLEFGVQCFCDNFLSNGALPTNDESRCSMNCAGNPLQKCGAGDILSVYHTGTLTTYGIPKAQTEDLPGSWEYAGCWNDNVPNPTTGIRKRSLDWQLDLEKNNTATSCLNLCSKYGYMSGGLQYGRQCFCGDHSNVLATGAERRPDSECKILCSGNRNYYCGDGDRNSYYRWTGAPLYVWGAPTGFARGSYEFLIGGRVVPLITTTGINDKVVFMEKSGTGVANATGVYELDLSEIDDFSKAWRTMTRPKTDIFCAAGITLPDKAGRQLNIGGWSGDSTRGVRLYAPDGSPGVPGVNQWQEDFNSLKLLDPRWYPSALNLVNGSVLVIGGEIGSNSAATPTLEILPAPPGGYSKYLDWLERTDPNNLYPFLWILPSGGIFIIYWNEARILDEKTFDTIKTIPNAPGSVNNFLAGRTYPLEGTGVMLPLNPPYTAAATFMACGGSAFGQALDNCVSVQPTLGNPEWVIERMPSARVLSCMTALPDGTFLILNGAKEGVAGFGLANTPNLEAVLYDPEKPVNQRMSKMATTIVARMYHSEAILLPDGRVLVSGSNPEDGKNPEEYRVEVFNPPYALNGLPKPSYVISNKDWGYGAAVQIQLSTGLSGGVRVSMMAAVSSTHGNSMGQRTIFLATSCAGTRCTVTTPPSAHVAPPGWYQIFLLDGPTPGRGIWIRIGGEIADTAGIGNWPATGGFNTPGLGPVGS